MASTMADFIYARSSHRSTGADMDPDCALCFAPASTECGCEKAALNLAVQQAESHMMATFFEEVRIWVREHAQTYILAYFEVLRYRRESHYRSLLNSLTQEAAYYNSTPHPTQLHSASTALKQGIDEDWRASVQKYPEVLEYYYSLVNFILPADDDQMVRDPPLSALAGARNITGRVRIQPSAATRETNRVMGMGIGLSGMGQFGMMGAGPSGGPLPGMENLGLPAGVVMGAAPEFYGEVGRRERHRSRSRTRSRSRSRGHRRRSRTRSRSRSRRGLRVGYGGGGGHDHSRH